MSIRLRYAAALLLAATSSLAWSFPSADAGRGVRLAPAPADTIPRSAPADTGLVRLPDPSDAPEEGGAAAADGDGEEALTLPVDTVMQMRATMYCLRGRTRTGVRVRDGITAADPAVLPLGSVVRVTHPDGREVGVFVVMDTGGAVRGNKLDLWTESCPRARQWGIRPVVAQVLDVGLRR